MPLRTSTSEELPSVNLTPMIDIVFLLIIFFMVGTQFTQTEREIGLKLPAAGQLKAMVAQPDRREVAVLADGKIVFDGQPVTTEQLTQRLRSMLVRYPDLRVAVRADADAKYQSVITAMSAVQGAGVTDLTTAYLVSANIYR